MRILPILCALLSLLLHGFAAESALPVAGQYVGTVKVTRHVSRTGATSAPRTDDLILITTAKAVASVSATGELTLVLATLQSPVPGKRIGDDVLKAQLNERGGFSYVVQEDALVSKSYTGEFQVRGNTLELSYDDIPFVSVSASIDESGFINAPGIVATPVPASFTEFSYKLRRVGP